MGQTFEDALLAHWRVPTGMRARTFPAELKVELHDGSAGSASSVPRGGPAPARHAADPGRLALARAERAHVCRGADGKPGIWFFSLDVSSRLAVEAARRMYQLPVFHARMSTERRDGLECVECARLDEPGRVFSGRYRRER